MPGKLFVESDHRALESKCYLIHCLTCKHLARGTDWGWREEEEEGVSE